MGCPGEGVQESRRWLVGGLEAWVHPLPHQDQPIGYCSPHEARGKPYGREDSALVHKGPQPVEEGEGTWLKHVARGAAREDRGEARGGCRSRGGGQEVHQEEVENGADDESGEDEVELVEAEVRPGCHVAEDAGGEAHELLHQDLEWELRVRGNPRSPSIEKKTQNSEPPEMGRGALGTASVTASTSIPAITVAGPSSPSSDPTRDPETQSGLVARELPEMWESGRIVREREGVLGEGLR